MKSIQRNQGGFSLVEILLVLGIIAILAIAAFIIFPQVQAANRANAEQANVTTITAGIKNLYGATRDYGTATTAIVNQARIFPASMNGGDFSAAAAINSSWDGAVTVIGASDILGAAPSATAADRFFTITYAAMPSEVCSRLVPGLVQNFEAIYVGTPAAATLASDPGLTAALCAASDTVDVTFVSN